MIPVKIFIGYDGREPIAFSVLAHSILKRATIPVMICPLTQWSLRHCSIYTRERGPLESTEFSLTRFLVPYLCDFKGRAVFMDCDMLCLTDIAELLDYSMDYKSVLVCKHDYTPNAKVKFLNQPQTVYPCKNWSSFIVFDCTSYPQITPDKVNKMSGLDLQRFFWLPEDRIGALPLEWNWLVGEYESNPGAKILHYTKGGPWFGYPTDAAIWFNERDSMMKPES